MERPPSSHSLPSHPDKKSVDEDAFSADVEAEAEELLGPLLESGNGVDPKQALSKDKHWSPYLKDLHILSFAFLFVFIAYSAVQNLESSINTDQGLGSTSLGILYLSMTISSLGAPMVVLWLGSKKSLVLGVLGYWVFIGANFCPSWYTLAPAAVFLGFTAAVFWVAEGTYLTFAARNHAAACHVSEATALGNFNGEFWAVYSVNQVVGNLVTLAVLQFGKEADPATESSGNARIFVPFLASMAVGTMLVLLLGPQSHTNTVLAVTDETKLSHHPQQGLGKASFALLSDKKLLLLGCLLFYSGMQQAFIWSDFTKDVVTATLGLRWVGGIMAVYGAADSFGSIIAGRSSSGFFSISVILGGGSLCQILVLAGLFFRDLGRELVDCVIIFLAAVGWGLGNAAFNTQISALLGLLYPRDIEAAFAQWTIWKSAAISVVFFASSFANFTTKLCILFISIVVSMGLFFVVIMKSRRVW